MFSWFQTSLSKTILITHGSIGCIRGRSCRVIDSERGFFWLQKRWTFRLWWIPQTCSFQCNQLDFQSLFIYLSIYPFSLLLFLASLMKLLLEKIYKNWILILMFGFFLVLDGGNLLQITEALDFHFQTAYLSVTYLDQFLTKRYIDVSSNYDLPKCNICLIFHFINLINWLSIWFYPFRWFFRFYAGGEELGDKIAINCLCFSGCKDGRMQCAGAIEVSIGRLLFLSRKSDSENGTFGSYHIGLEHEYHYSLFIPFLLHQKVRKCFQHNATYLYCNYGRWINHQNLNVFSFENDVNFWCGFLMQGSI